MKHTAQAIESTLHRYVDSNAYVESLDISGSVSPFLSGAFEAYQAFVLGERLVFVYPGEAIEDIRTLRRQLAQLASGIGRPETHVVAYLDSSLHSSVRRSLIESHTPFTTTAGDFYIPCLGLMLQARGEGSVRRVRGFSPADQSVFLYGLYAEASFSQDDVMETTGLSSASVSRALANLVASKALDYETAGRTKRKKNYFIADKAAYYRVGRRHFGTAVVKVILTNGLPQEGIALESSLTALSRMSNLLPPSREIRAVGPSWSTDGVSLDPLPDGTYRCSVQVLKYEPAPFARDGVVDPFTMLVTIPEGDLADERVRIALRETLEGYAWYQG